MSKSKGKNVFSHVQPGGNTLTAKYSIDNNKKTITMENNDRKAKFSIGQEKHEIVKGIVSLWYMNTRIEGSTYDAIESIVGAIKDMLETSFAKS